VSPLRPAFLWSLVALQVLLPGLYYLRADAEDDERFAWRMFSALRFRRCRVEAQDEQGASVQALELPGVLHASWIGLVQRGRRDVVEHLLSRRCDAPKHSGATLLRACVEVDASRVPLERYRYDCRTRHLSVTHEAL
jgi:hypothetical protein